MTGGWNFVAAAYAVAGVGTLALLGWAYAALRRAEGRAEALRDLDRSKPHQLGS